MTLPPAWILMLLIVPLASSETAIASPADSMSVEARSNSNSTLVRQHRGTSDRDRRLVEQYPTYYLAHSYTDEAGERRNVLIPVQGGQTADASTTAQPHVTPDYRQFVPSPQITPNGQPAAISQAVLLGLRNAGFLPGQQTPTLTPSPQYTGNQIQALVYAYRPPSKPQKSQEIGTHQYQPQHVLKLNSPPQRGPKAHPYIGYNLPFKPTKLYNVDTGHRFRPRPKPDKNKYTATKLQFSIRTTPSPYTNKVRFELEDAMIPGGHSIELQPVPSSQATPQGLSDTTPVSGLSQYLEPEQQKQLYYQHKQQQVQFIQVPQQETLQENQRPSPSSEPEIEPQQVQYIHENDIGPSPLTPTRPPNVHYVQGAPSPSSRPATLHQHFAQRQQASQTYFPVSENEARPTPQQQIEYVPVTDIEPAPRPTPPQQQIQYIRVPDSSNLRGPSHHVQYTPEDEGVHASPQPHIQYVLESETVRPSPRPQVHHSSDNGDLRASMQPQIQYESEDEGGRATPPPHVQFVTESGQPSPQQQHVQHSQDSGDQPQINYVQDTNDVTPSPQPQIQYVPESGTMRTPSQHVHYVQDTNEVTPSPHSPVQYVPESASVRTPPQQHVHYVQDTNGVTPTPQPEYHYVTESNNVTPTPAPELSYTPGKFPPAVQEAFDILKQTDQLPQRITPDNIDGSIKTLALILQRLQQQEKLHKFHPAGTAPQVKKPKEPVPYQQQEQTYPQGGSTPGRPGIDYPIYSTIPKTSFDCSTQRYKGFFGDPDTHCQVWHYCDLNGGQASFLCPNGTIFNQVALTCDWWFNVRCSATSQLYVLNERLYKYILPFAPSFPEDYSGPVVDRYLTAKFKEQEAKNKIKALKALITTPAPESTSPTLQVTTEATA